MMEKLNLEVTLEEANVILAALGQQPYLKVVDLIRKIQGQGAAQLRSDAAEKEAGPDLVTTEMLYKNGK
ncbi:hypothetical protein LVD15_15285 [Fulvivirga maritima]|uniref:hypothetical protein n=1 Tax=Fulvivirga maritima TaxID=2904247 RepID=UPI001F1D4A67|nr:hypothetical protein [Fulvivirga maritima]UII24677.1 hypothetical protein LVD15_15285 [Fulvivirga maritima]